MPIGNRNIRIDNADIPNQPYAPMRPDYRYNDYQPPAQPPLDARLFAFLLGFGVIVAAIIAYIVVRLANYVSAVNNGNASPFDQTLLNVIKVALTGGIVGLIVALVGGSSVYVLKLMLVRMQNNHPVSIFDIVGGWRYTGSHTFGREALEWYHNERTEWAKNSLYWSLNTLDLSRSDRVDNYGADSNVIEAEASDPISKLPQLTGKETMIERLLKAGLINRSGNSLLVGFVNPTQPIYIELEDTGFIAQAGQPRVGKSATATLLIAQVALIPDSVIIVCDKHGKKDDSLIQRLQPIAHRIARMAISTAEIIEAIDYWHEIGANRMLDEEKRTYPPALLVIDEFTGMIIMQELPAATIQKLVSAAVEYPKIQAYGLVIGHQWTGKLLGGNMGLTLRRVSTQRIIQRVDPQDAEFLLPAAYAKQCQGLPPGKAIFMGAAQTTPIEIAIPYMTVDDLTYLARVFPPSPAQNAPKLPNVTSVSSVSSALESGNDVLPDEDTLADLDPADDPTSAIDLAPDQLSSDRRARLAKLLLREKITPTKYTYTYRQVRAMSNLKTATICALAIEVGRATAR